MKRLNAFLAFKEYGEIDEIDLDDWPKILENFYGSVRTKKNGELYQTSSFKVVRAGLNRWFKVNKDLDIVNDSRFSKANLVFNSVQEKAKKRRQGSCEEY